jgi:hypothetical protein
MPPLDNLPRPPAPPERSFWTLMPRQSVRRVLFLLLALAGILFIKRTGGLSFGNLLDAVGPASPAPRAPGAAQEPPVYHLKVTPPEGPAGKSRP